RVERGNRGHENEWTEHGRRERDDERAGQERRIEPSRSHLPRASRRRHEDGRGGDEYDRSCPDGQVANPHPEHEWHAKDERGVRGRGERNEIRDRGPHRAREPFPHLLRKPAWRRRHEAHERSKRVDVVRIERERTTHLAHRKYTLIERFVHRARSVLR